MSKAQILKSTLCGDSSDSLVNMLGRSLLRMNQRRFHSCKMSSLSIPFQEINGREVQLHAHISSVPVSRADMFVASVHARVSASNACKPLCASVCVSMSTHGALMHSTLWERGRCSRISDSSDSHTRRGSGFRGRAGAKPVCQSR